MGKDMRVENQEKLLSFATHLPSIQIHTIQGSTALVLENVLGRGHLSLGKTRASHLPWSCSGGASGHLAYVLFLWKRAFVPALLTGGTLHGL